MIKVSQIKQLLRDFRKKLFCDNKEQANINKYKYFLFIDSKVPNIIEQIYPYFYKGFFNKDKVVIVYRHYFENIKYLKRAIKKYNLNSYCLINLRDIPSIQNGIWFYTHNSMTNLAVINKNVYSKHIWIGHGDSEKVSSYKKIIRIYDYSLVSGENAIERFYKYNLFRKEESYRFIRVGKVVLCSVLPNKKSGVLKKSILFAPTWEGPMKEESYSTLHLHNENVKFIDKIATLLKIENIVIKLHPNTGIRDSKLIEQTLKTIETIIELNKKIIFIAEKSDWIYSWVYKRFKEKLEYRDKLYDIDEYNFEVGISNISAMASMIYAEDIKTFVLYDSKIDIQARVDSVAGKKIDLQELSILNSKNIFEQEKIDGLIDYEKDWEKLTQEAMFREVVKYINQ